MYSLSFFVSSDTPSEGDALSTGWTTEEGKEGGGQMLKLPIQYQRGVEQISV